MLTLGLGNRCGVSGMQFKVAIYRLAAAVSLVSLLGCGDSPTNPKVLPQPDLPRPAYSEPIWSPDGLRLGFNHRPLDSIHVDGSGRHHYSFRDTLSGFWMVDSSGENLHRVFSASLGDPAWSPDGNWIAYYTSSDIWKVPTTAAGLDTTRVERLTFQGGYFSPAWNPPSTWLLFWKSGITAGVYRLPAGGGGPERIGGIGWRDPDWSRDSTKLVFVMDFNDSLSNAIGSSDPGGGSPNLIRSGLIAPQYPKWSPDGTQIAFVDRSLVTQQTHLWLMNADGTNQRMATPDPIGSGYSWSPDGVHIAYVRLNPYDHS